MDPLIRILHLEDDPADAELARARLDEAGLTYRVTRVQTRVEFEEALQRESYDIILTDFQLPIYDGMSALRLALERCPDVPFIFVSGTMGEDAAIEGLIEGATDYVLKQKLSRLAPAINRALREAENRRARRRAEEQLHKLSRAVEQSASTVVITDPRGYIEFANPRFTETTGYTQTEAIGKHTRVLKSGHTPAETYTQLWETITAGKEWRGEFLNKKKNGELYWESASISPVKNADGVITNFLAVKEDITERKRSERALAESEAKMRSILDSVDEGFIIVDREYRILSANRAFCSMLSSSEDQVVGRRCYEVARHALRPCFETGEACAVRHTFENATPHFIPHTHKEASGATRFLELKSYPITDASGKVVSVIETVNDVTEKRKLEERLAQAQKMESVGRLAGGVAHDFNNMLGVILGHTELALDGMDPAEPLFATLRQIRKAAGHSADLTRQLLAFARKQTVSPRVIDLNETVEGMLKMLRRLIGEDIVLAWLPGTRLWPIEMDPSQIDQILANLCVNARDAIAGVGRMTIETGMASFTATDCIDRPELIPGDFVMLTVSDNGHGMAKEILDQIFEPFFTTKVMGKGTGLGLSTVYGIVKQNNGFINVYSEPEHGTTFKIYLPRHISKPGQLRTESPAAPAVGGDETILLVEDEPTTRDIARLILEKWGYRVLAASTPGEAVRVAGEHPLEIHLLLTDVVMPEMNGRDLAKTIASFYPEIRTLFMSGYTGDIIAHQGVLDAGVHFIQKPFSMGGLAAKVREVLDSN
jgi:PAS domain S-box-containing protein